LSIDLVVAAKTLLTTQSDLDRPNTYYNGSDKTLCKVLCVQHKPGGTESPLLTGVLIAYIHSCK
jgi:hypothetical protein